MRCVAEAAGVGDGAVMSPEELRDKPTEWFTERAILVSDSGKPDGHFIREAAILDLARDCLLGHDSHQAENAVAWARRLMNGHEGEEHSGDCTRQPWTCAR